MSTLSPRRALVDRARENWIRKLIDLSRRNNLLYFRELKTGTLDLTDVDPGELDALFAGKPVQLSVLIKEDERTRGQSTAREIWRRAQANLEEKGLETLFVAVGMATWEPPDGGRPPEAAVILLPVAMEVKGLSGQITLRRSGEAAANLVLLHVLDVEYGVVLDPDSFLGTDASADIEESFDPQTIFARLRSVCKRIRGFNITRRIVLGNFSFQKLAMVKDLREHGGAMVTHDLIAALAGDAVARPLWSVARLRIYRTGDAERDARSPGLRPGVYGASERQVRGAVYHGPNRGQGGRPRAMGATCVRRKYKLPE